MYNKPVLRKLTLISKFMTSQTGQQVITIYILFNISRSKGNQAMKFGPLISSNMRNIFLEIFTQNGVKKLISDSCKKIKKLAYLLINCLKCYKVCFDFKNKKLSISLDLLFCFDLSWSANYIKTKVPTTCFYLTKNFFKKQKEFWS